MNTPGTTPAELRSLVERIQNLESQIKELNSDKSDIYAEAKGKGFDVPGIKAVVSYLRKDADTRAAQRKIFDLYLSHVVGMPIATRAPAQQTSKSAAAAPTKQTASARQPAETISPADTVHTSPSAAPAVASARTTDADATAPCEQSGDVTAPCNLHLGPPLRGRSLYATGISNDGGTKATGASLSARTNPTPPELIAGQDGTMACESISGDIRGTFLDRNRSEATAS